MNMTEVRSRIAEADQEMRAIEAMDEEKRDLDRFEKLTDELVELEARKKELEELEERKMATIEVNKGAGEVIERAGTGAAETDVKDTDKYKRAFLKAIKTGDETEARALLSTNAASGGTIPVPTYLDDEIRNAWENADIMSLVNRTTYKGNVKVGFEYSATGAAVHAEGADAPDEETLILGTVELKAESIKKWITVSDEAIDGTTIDTIDYIYREIAQKIAEKAESILIGKITASPAASTTTAPGVPVYKADPAVDTIVGAVALLSGQAKDLYIAMNRQTYPAFVKLALEAGYAIDVFDGLKDRIKYTDALPAYSAASEDDTYMIIGSFSYGAQANFPGGNDMTIKLDDLSLAEKDLVKIVGRQYVGMGVVAPKAFVKVTKDTEGA